MSVPVKRKELHLLTCEEVGYLLCHLGLDKHVSHFERFGVDGIVLAALKTEKDLEGELGMTSHVQRINLISHVKEFVDKKGVTVDLLDPVRGAGTRTRALSSLNVDEVCTLLECIELPSIVEAATTFRVDGASPEARASPRLPAPEARASEPRAAAQGACSPRSRTRTSRRSSRWSRASSGANS